MDVIFYSMVNASSLCLLMDRQINSQPEGISGTDVLAPVAAMDKNAHGFPKRPEGSGPGKNRSERRCIFRDRWKKVISCP
jgi:hypothetical protein